MTVISGEVPLRLHAVTCPQPSGCDVAEEASRYRRVCLFPVKGSVCTRGFFFFFFCIAGVSVVFCLLVVAPGVQSEQGTDGQWLCDAVY